MKTIKTENKLTPEHALDLAEENGWPVKNCKFWNKDHDKPYYGELTSVASGLVTYPYRKNRKSSFANCALVTERLPNEVPDEVPELPEPQFAYIGVGSITLENDPTELGYVVLNPQVNIWLKVNTPVVVEDCHLAIDVRTNHAAETYPELVKAMDYSEVIVAKPGEIWELKYGQTHHILIGSRDNEKNPSENYMHWNLSANNGFTLYDHGWPTSKNSKKLADNLLQYADLLKSEKS